MKDHPQATQRPHPQHEGNRAVCDLQESIHGQCQDAHDDGSRRQQARQPQVAQRCRHHIGRKGKQEVHGPRLEYVRPEWTDLPGRQASQLTCAQKPSQHRDPGKSLQNEDALPDLRHPGQDLTDSVCGEQAPQHKECRAQRRIDHRPDQTNHRHKGQDLEELLHLGRRRRQGSGCQDQRPHHRRRIRSIEHHGGGREGLVSFLPLGHLSPDS